MKTELDTLLIALYVLVDDYVIPAQGRRRPGRPKKLTDAELVCLAMAQVLLGARSEHHWMRICYGRLGHLFPYLPNQPGYHKRVKAAAPLICQATEYLATLCPSWIDDLRLFDATPVPCGTSRETVRRSELAGLAGYGYRASHSRWYWGLKLYLLTTGEGMPVAWCLANPKIGEREVAQELLAHARDRAARRDDRADRQRVVWQGDGALRGPTRSGYCWCGRTARTRNADSATWPACANGSSQSTTPSKANSTSNSTAGAPKPASMPASPNASSPWPPRSGITGQPTRPSSVH